MEIEVDEIRASIVYQHLIRIIVPRPIAWVSTVSRAGVTNLAPFSFFTGVGSRPPSLLFCPALTRDGRPKHTLRNILETEEFVVNVVCADQAVAMNQTAAELPDQESEFEAFQIAPANSVTVRPPRVARAPVAIECQLMRVIELDSGPGGANIVIGRIRHLAMDERVLDAQGFADPRLLEAVGRMGGAAYCRTTDCFDLPRPD